MKSNKVLFGAGFLLLVLYIVLTRRVDGFKNVDVDARNQLEKIVNKVLPENAVCIRGAQCISGKCLETNNETTYGYCSKPL
jgi:hypothetical protein